MNRTLWHHPDMPCMLNMFVHSVRRGQRNADPAVAAGAAELLAAQAPQRAAALAGLHHAAHLLPGACCTAAAGAAQARMHRRMCCFSCRVQVYLMQALLSMHAIMHELLLLT
jgi:hypothetical protein